MDWSDLLWKGNPHMVFPSHKTLTKTILPFMTKHILEEFVLLHVNVVVSIITFNFWMNKGVFNTFTFVISFLTLDWESKDVTIGVFDLKGIWDNWFYETIAICFSRLWSYKQNHMLCERWRGPNLFTMKMPLSLLWIVRISRFRTI
jgi:hypothetical protein